MIPAIKVLSSKKHLLVLENKKNLITLTHKPFQGLLISTQHKTVSVLLGKFLGSQKLCKYVKVSLPKWSLNSESSS